MRSTCSTQHKVSPVVVSTIPLTSVASTSSVLNRTIKCSPSVMLEDSSSTAILSHGPTKKVEQGIIQFFSPTTFVIVFESFPYWILALHPSFVEDLYFPQFNSIVSLQHNLESSATTGKFFYTLLSEVFDSSKFHFCSCLSSKHVVLITGSISFANHQICLHVPSDIPWLFVSDSVTRSRRSSSCSSPFVIHRARHSVFGGPTNAEVSFASSYPTFLPSSTAMRRTIGDFVKHSIRPIPAPVLCPAPCVDHLSLLPMSKLSSPIFFPSHYSRTGFGQRVLTPNELSFVFGLSTHFGSFVDVDIYPIPPVQILTSLLRQFLPLVVEPLRLTRPAVAMIPTPSPIPDSFPTYIKSLRRVLPNGWSTNKSASAKAAKADDAEVDFSLWNDRILGLWPSCSKLLPLLRSFLLRRQMRRLYLEFVSYLKITYGEIYIRYVALKSQLYGFYEQTGGETSPLYSTHEAIKVKLKGTSFSSIQRDINFGMEALASYCGSTFFSWDRGSTLLFWRWHPNLRKTAQLGFKTHIASALPSNKRKARKPSNEIFLKLFSKILKGIKRGYLKFIPSWRVKNLIDYFGVPKAEDIRMVQNGSSCGLNSSVWASNFWLPTSQSMTRVLGYNYKSVDIDLGEMFLNFPLDPELIPYSVMDVTCFRQNIIEEIPTVSLPDRKRVYLANTRCWMGFRPSPEWSCRFYYLAEEFIRGNESDPSNPLHWSEIKLNLIGNENFNPSLPNVIKWNTIYHRIAGDIKAYVDDLRAIGWSLEHAWKIARQIASRLQYLGIQDAARKRRIDNGPWAGCVYLSSESKIQKTVTKEKWTKGKEYIDDLNNLIHVKKLCTLNFKYLEKIRGYLCHLAMTFDLLFPYLKGFHQTLCSYLPKRNEDGWKIHDLEWLGFLEQEKLSGRMTEAEAEDLINFKYDPKSRPKSVKLLPRFYTCLEALTQFFIKEDPPKVTERSANVSLLVYGFVDASKSGFGASIDYNNSVRYRIGIWGPDEQSESSNYREFANLIETLEQEYQEGRLKDSTVIMATDNSTVEAAIYKGNSTSKKLFELVVRFKVLELHSGCKFIITHVAGTRMQLQGTDGISRGNLMEGISLGKSMLKFCPWGLSALERCSSLEPWLVETFGPSLEILQPKDWYSRGHEHSGGYMDDYGFFRLRIKPGLFLWHPPPAAADAALEEIRKARLKRRESGHVIVIPKLVTTQWLKQVYKASDIVLTIPATNTFWPSTMCESLILAILFPYYRSNPWQLRSTPKLMASGREMRRLFKEDEMAQRNFLHPRHGYSPCSQTWCGKCYTSSQRIKFHIHRPEELSERSDDSENQRLHQAWGKKLRDKTDFMVARHCFVRKVERGTS